MFHFLADLFAATPASRTPALRVRLSLDGMETRCTPALLVNPGTLRGFNPQPEPPLAHQASETAIRVPEDARGIIAIH